jgi:hypothetical protein
MVMMMMMTVRRKGCIFGGQCFNASVFVLCALLLPSMAVLEKSKFISPLFLWPPVSTLLMLLLLLLTFIPPRV